MLSFMFVVLSRRKTAHDVVPTGVPLVWCRSYVIHLLHDVVTSLVLISSQYEKNLQIQMIKRKMTKSSIAEN